MTRVLCFGTFDELHPGHNSFFEQAKKRGDELHVIVARDKTVMTVKDHLPHQNEDARLKAVHSHPLVTKAYLGSLDDKYAMIFDIRPDIIVLGYDQYAFTDALESVLREGGLTVTIERAQAFEPHRYKSSFLHPYAR